MELPQMYKDAPTKIRVGRIILFIGCILFFVAAILVLAEAIWTIVEDQSEHLIDWRDPTVIFHYAAVPVLFVFYIVAGIGGICYVYDRHRLKVFTSLAGVIFLVVFIIGTVTMFRDLFRNLSVPGLDGLTIFLSFLIDFISIQVSGGVFFIGWFMIKDYTGD